MFHSGLSRTWTLLLATLCCLWGCTGAACGSTQQSAQQSAQQPSAPVQVNDNGLPRPKLRLAIVTDLKGYLEPCGCTSRPLGGIDKLAQELAQVRAGGPTLFLSAGDLFFDGLEHSPEAQTQERWKAETLAEILSTLDLGAAGLGQFDLREGAEQISALASHARFPFLLDGVTGMPSLTAGGIVKEIDGLKIGVFAVAELDPAPAELTVADPRETAISTAASLRARGAQIVIALVRGTRRLARRVADGAQDVDFVVQGGVDEMDASAPAVVEGRAVLHASRQGMGLLVVDVYPTATRGAWTDIGAWSRTVERTRLTTSMQELRTRIQQWKAAGNVAANEIAAQEARLAEMLREHDALAARPVTQGPAFAARYIELDRDHASDARIKALVDAYSRRVNEHNKTALANLTPRPVQDGQPHYVGVTRCESCHAPAVRWWRDTLHGHAYATLQNVNKEYNLSCVGCHVTGYNQAGGSTVTHNETLQNVQCEQCHGPGSAHADNPLTSIARGRTVPVTVCAQCHNPEHSDRFNYETYLRMMRGPGHGAPLAQHMDEHVRERFAAAWLPAR